MKSPDHLPAGFLTEVSDLLVSAMSERFSNAVQESRQYRVKFNDTAISVFVTIVFEGLASGTKYVTLHFDGHETIVFEFNYVPNAEVKIVSYHRSDDSVPTPPEALLNLLRSGLAEIAKGN